MSVNNLVFWLIAVPVGVVWSVLLFRYARANHRWIVHRAEQSALAPADGFVARAMGRVPHWPPGIYYFVYTLLTIVRHGPMFMFREDPNPTTEALRRDAMERYTPLLVIFACGLVLWFVIAIPVLIYVGIHALVNR